MTDAKESVNGKENEIYEEFPYPKLIKLFDFYFPKTPEHEKINWRKILRVWAKWAPWLAILLMILPCCIIPRESNVGPFAFVALVGSFLNFVYYLVLACFAKLIKRSPQVLLALTPRVPFICFVILSVCQLVASTVKPEGIHSEWEKRHEKRALRREERRKMFTDNETWGNPSRLDQTNADTFPTSTSEEP